MLANPTREPSPAPPEPLVTTEIRGSLQRHDVSPPAAPTRSLPPAPSHPTVTRSKDGTRKKKSWNDGTIRYRLPHTLSISLSTDEPTCFTQANRKPEWRAAMTEEINALLKNQTWVYSFHHLLH